MGADGPGLFSDDTACDVRAEYQAALESGCADGEAEAMVLRQFAQELDDPDERAAVWLALASTQSTLGRLSDATRREVLAILDAGGDLDRWQDAGRGAVRRRAAVLAKVRAQVTGPQLAPRRIRRPRRRPSDSWRTPRRSCRAPTSSRRSRHRRPPWKKVELRVVDDSRDIREQAGISVIGSLPADDSADAPDPKAAATWSEIATYLLTRDRMI